MTAKTRIPADVLVALVAAGRNRGWNNRPREVQRFDLDQCALFVVPFRRWAYRRREQQTAAWWSAHAVEAEKA